MQPIRFHPLLKQTRWGGRRLGTHLNKPIGAETNYAESWEICDHFDTQTVVACGEFAGLTSHQLVQEAGERLFGSANHPAQFPLLIKFLDCHDTLSLQVHPDDELADKYYPGENGKTEAWVILEAASDSFIYTGLKADVSESHLRDALAGDRIHECLHRVPPQVGDCFFIPAGTVHALGQGLLVAEVQQTNDITYRLHDWNRLGQDGKPRELHLERGIECIDFARGPIERVMPQVVGQTAAGTYEHLITSDYFRLCRAEINSTLQLPQMEDCQIVMVLSGSGDLNGLPTEKGHTWLIPAECQTVAITSTTNSPVQVLHVEVI